MDRIKRLKGIWLGLVGTAVVLTLAILIVPKFGVQEALAIFLGLATGTFATAFSYVAKELEDLHKKVEGKG